MAKDIETKPTPLEDMSSYHIKECYPLADKIMRNIPVVDTKELSEELKKLPVSANMKDNFRKRNKALIAKRKFSGPTIKETSSIRTGPKSYDLKSGGKVKKNYSKGGGVRAAKY